MQIGVVAAMCREARLLLGRRVAAGQIVDLDSRVSVAVCGIGPQCADEAARALLARGCRSLVSFGTAGSLRPEVPAGTLIIAQCVRDESGREYIMDDAWRKRLLTNYPASDPALVSALMVSTAQAQLSSEAKQHLAEHTGASAVDMESATVARIAEQHQIPVLVVRAVSDSVAQQLPEKLLATVDRYGQLCIPAFLKALCQQPGIIGQLYTLSAGIGAAERVLAQVIASTGPRFCA